MCSVLGNSQYVDYSDYQPMSFPLRSENQSPEYNENTKSLDSDDWQSPISYLKKRGYMPATGDENSDEVHAQGHDEHDKSNLISPEDENQCLGKNCLAVMEIEQPEVGKEASKDKSEPQDNEPKSEKTGIISKVKNKFLSLFSSRSSNKSDESHKDEKNDFTESEHYELADFDGHDLPEHEMFPRSADNKTAKPSNVNRDDLSKNLTETDVMYIKNFIKCFKDTRKGYENKLANASDGAGARPSGNSTGNISVTETFKNISSATEHCNVQTTAKSIIQTATKFVDGYGLSTPNTIGLGTKDEEADEITVDLDISQKNGTGQVILGGAKTTECAPLRLKDMSFDLEWTKNNKPLEVGLDGRMDDVDGSFQSNHQDQSLAGKFLKDVNSHAQRNEEHLRPLYSYHFLDSQQKIPDESVKPARVNTKREVPFKSKLLSDSAFLQNADIYDDYNYEISEKDARKRRTRLRGKNRSRKRPKLKSRNRQNLHESDVESVEDDDAGVAKNDHPSFDELNDIKFRVSSADEEAISKFIANLKSPPELFSFDVDQYLRSAEMENKPQTQKFQAPEARKYYEFADAPAVEREKIPLIENPTPEDDEQPYSMGDKKRDLLRQHIKGVSNALLQKCPDDDDSSQRRSFVNTNLPVDHKYIDSNLDYAKPDEFLENDYQLNDGSAQIFDFDKEDSDADSGGGKYSPNSEIDKSRDLGSRSLQEDELMRGESPGLEGNVDMTMAEIGRHVEEKDPESSDGNY